MIIGNGTSEDARQLYRVTNLQAQILKTTTGARAVHVQGFAMGAA
jgi:hypothetical protein